MARTTGKVTAGRGRPPRPATGVRALVALGVLQLVLFGAAAAAGVGGALPLPTLPLLLMAFVGCLAAASLVPGGGGGNGAPGPVPSPTAVIWVFGLTFRVIFLPLDPVLSDDVWRYLWDGVVQRGGINPFLHPPSAPELAHLRTPWHPLINNPDVPTIYPGAAQLVFLGVAGVGGGLLLLKGVLVGVELLAAAVLYRVAVWLDRPADRVLVLVLWSPLAVVETAWSGHVDALGLLFLMVALAAAVRPPGARPLLAGGALALAALVKVAPAAALPVLMRRPGWRSGVAFVAVALLVSLPYLGAGPRLFTGLLTYAEHWRFNEALFGVLELIAPGGREARTLSAVLVLLVVAGVTWFGFAHGRALLWILGTGLLLSPTLHPWYLLWILPLAALQGSRGWILGTGTILLAYWGLGAYQRTGIWPHPDALRLVIWGPVILLLAYDAIRALRRPARDPVHGPDHAAPQPAHREEQQEGH